MTAIPAADIDHRLERLADELTAAGVLRSPEWRKVFTKVPRHVFVPRYYRPSIADDGMPQWEPITPENAGVEPWLDAVYSNETLVTQVNEDTTSMGLVRGDPTSSSTLPGLIVQLLELLDIRQGNVVLASGTGTGYTTALLCERLGADHVVTVDADSGLVHDAEQRLSSIGYVPTTVVGDGLAGHREKAPYDRILATHAVPSIPYAWVEQTTPGGAIVATLGGSMTLFGTVCITVQGKREAAGRFLADDINFMMARQHRPPRTGLHLGLTADDTRPSSIPPTHLDDPEFGFMLQLAVPRVNKVWLADQEGKVTHTVLKQVDGESWATLRHTDGLVEQAGPARLWDRVANAYAQWVSAGHPTKDRYGITVSPAGQHVWLDDPDTGPRWPLV